MDKNSEACQHWAQWATQLPLQEIQLTQEVGQVTVDNVREKSDSN